MIHGFIYLMIKFNRLWILIILIVLPFASHPVDANSSLWTFSDTTYAGLNYNIYVKLTGANITKNQEFFSVTRGSIIHLQGNVSFASFNSPVVSDSVFNASLSIYLIDTSSHFNLTSTTSGNYLNTTHTSFYYDFTFNLNASTPQNVNVKLSLKYYENCSCNPYIIYRVLDKNVTGITMTTPSSVVPVELYLVYTVTIIVILGFVMSKNVRRLVRTKLVHNQKKVAATQCPNCSASIVADSIYCQVCGYQLQEKSAVSQTAEQLTQCPNCDAKLAGDSIFCKECGYQLQE